MPNRIVPVEDYEQFVGTETIERVRKKAKPLQDLHVAKLRLCGKERRLLGGT